MTSDVASSLFLSDHSQRDKPWDTHRANADRVAALYKAAGESVRYHRMQNCAESLEFALVAEDEETFRYRLKTALFCRQRHCPICQWRRALMLRSRLLKAFHPDFDKGKTRSRYVLEDYPKARFIFLTLTVKNCDLEDLRSTVLAMSKGWRRLINRKFFPATGWIRALEITRNAATGQAHPHFHCLLMVEPSYFKGQKYISQKNWTQYWKEAMRLDYDPVVNVKAVKGKDGTKIGITSGILETLKYEVKEQDLIVDADWLLELTQQLSKIRAFAVGGILKEYIDENEPDNYIRVDEDDSGEDLSGFVSNVYAWRRESSRYAWKSTNIPQNDNQETQSDDNTEGE